MFLNNKCVIIETNCFVEIARNISKAEASEVMRRLYAWSGCKEYGDATLLITDVLGGCEIVLQNGV